MTELSVSPEKVVEQYREAMPGNVGAVFADLWNDVVALERKVQFFHDCAKEKLIRFWNDTRPGDCEVGKIH